MKYKSFKTEISLNRTQVEYIEKCFDICINAYNEYLKANDRSKEIKKVVVTANDFYNGIKTGRFMFKGSADFLKAKYRTAGLTTIKNGELFVNRYVYGSMNWPNTKKAQSKHISLHFKPGKYEGEYIKVERHRIHIPYLDWVRIKEKGYLPYKQGHNIISGKIKKEAGRYYVIILVAIKEESSFYRAIVPENAYGIGIDLNITNFATLSDGTVFDNINKAENVLKLKKKLKKEQKDYYRLTRIYRKLPDEEKAKLEFKNMKKRAHKIDVLHKRIKDIKDDYERKCVKAIIDKKPDFVVMEDLKVKEMTNDRRFSKYIADSSFYSFRLRLYIKCLENGIEFRLADKRFPSSHICHDCGAYFTNLTIDDRVFYCPGCGVEIQRDFNASLNLRDTTKYTFWNPSRSDDI